MATRDAVIRAWKDPAYRAGLGADELRTLPPSPAGMVELREAELIEHEGGATPSIFTIVSLLYLIESCRAS